MGARTYHFVHPRRSYSYPAHHSDHHDFSKGHTRLIVLHLHEQIPFGAADFFGGDEIVVRRIAIAEHQ